jgi:hypothetical protein
VRRRAALAIVVSTLQLVGPSPASAGNDEGVLIGNEAAMTGGAVSAVTADGSAMWYDPAGIAAVTRGQLDLSGSATVLRIAETPRLLSSSTTGRSADGGYLEVIGIPSAVTLVRLLEPRLAFGFGIFTPQLTNHTDRVGLIDDTAGLRSQWQLVQQENTQSTYAGLSLGYQLSSTFRIGASLFGLYRQETRSTHFFGGATDPSMTDVFVTGRSSLSSLQSVGIELEVGMQWDVVPGLTVAAALRSPDLQLGSLFRSTSSMITATHGGDITFEPMDSSGLVPNVGIVEPMRLRLGVAWRARNAWLGIDADIAHELIVPELNIERRWVANVHVGGRYWIDENASIGAGVFTDVSPTRRIVQYGQTQIDFVGGSLGVEIHTPHTLGPNEQAATIVFAQTFALRYAVGVGQIGGLSFDDAMPSMQSARPAITPTTVHELSLHIGSALYF